MVEQRTDEELVGLFRSGTDREGAFLALFDRHAPVTYGFLRRRIGDPDIAAELNQELFIAVLEGLERFRGDSSFKTWLFRLAHNHLSNLRRRWRTHVDERSERAIDDLLGEVLPSADESPDETVAKEQTSRLLENCLAALPEVERAVVVGQYFDGVTLEELTQRFHMTNRSGARASLIAAQRKLRRCMEQAGITAAPGTRVNGNGRTS